MVLKIEHQLVGNSPSKQVVITRIHGSHWDGVLFIVGERERDLPGLGLPARQDSGYKMSSEGSL